MFAKKLSKSRGPEETSLSIIDAPDLSDALAPVFKLFDRSSNPAEKMLLIEVIGMAAFGNNGKRERERKKKYH